MSETLLPAEESFAPTFFDRIGAVSRHIALLAAWIATCGSLFFSEVLYWEPCELCWFQRILMYPLAALLAIGILRNDQAIHHYVLPLSLLGAGTALYHYLLIKTTIFPPPPCTSGVSCTVDYIDIFGFINIPFLALIAFTIISVMMGSHALYAASFEEPLEAPFAANQVASRSQIAVPAIVAVVVVIFIGLGGYVLA